MLCNIFSMIERNILIIFLVCVFISLSFILSIKLKFIETIAFSAISLFVPFILFHYFSSKNNIYFKIELWNYGFLISFISIFIKFPIFPFLYFEVYYKKSGRILKKEISQSEIFSYIFIFLFSMLIIGFLGIALSNFKLSLIAFSILFSILLPYKNSVGNIFFLINPLACGLLLGLSFSFYLISYFFVLFL